MYQRASRVLLAATSTKDVVQKLHTALQSQDLASVGGVLSAAKVRFGPRDGCRARQTVPFLGTYIDGSTFLELLGKVAEFRRYEISSPPLVDGDRFAAQFSADLLLKASGKLYPHDGIHLGLVKDGKIVELNIQTDTLALFNALAENSKF